MKRKFKPIKIKKSKIICIAQYKKETAKTMKKLLLIGLLLSISFICYSQNKPLIFVDDANGTGSAIVRFTQGWEIVSVSMDYSFSSYYTYTVTFKTYTVTFKKVDEKFIFYTTTLKIKSKDIIWKSS